jgi:hypothetical protein
MSLSPVKEQFEKTIQQLEQVARDPTLIKSNIEEAIFVDDILLRLKVWAADIHLDEDSTESTEQIKSISYSLQATLIDLSNSCAALWDALKVPEKSKSSHEGKNLLGSRV